MSETATFSEIIRSGYTHKGKSIVIGGAALNGQTFADHFVSIPLKTLNRHGLIAGATGTGKTKTLQVLAEQMSLEGIPTLLMDIKGDLSGLGASGIKNEFIEKRHATMNLPYDPHAFPVELFTLSGDDGVQLRSTVEQFGPILLSKILDLNSTQSSIISLVFVFCKNKKLPLISLLDLRKVLQYITQEGKAEIEQEYGQVSSASVNTILRKMIELEEQGADIFFGEKAFEVSDLKRTTSDGKGIISILRLMNIQHQPKLFSTFMLNLLNEIYATFPEVGDLEKPKLCLFIDEAHLVFSEASNVLIDQIEVIVKLIRSKGVGIYFCTQNPIDVPDAILGQLGLKIQHGLRAFTEKDRKAIVKAAQNYPSSTFYEVENQLTTLGTGEAFVTALNEKGIPTPLAITTCRAPLSRMDILTDSEVQTVVRQSMIATKYTKDETVKGAAKLLEEKTRSTENQTEKPTSKEAEREIKRQEREAARIEKEEEREAARKLKGRERMVRDITRAATSSRSKNSIIGLIIKWIFSLFSKK